MKITGLPFTVNISAITTDIATHQFAISGDIVWGEMEDNTTNIMFLESHNNGGWSDMNITAGTGKFMSISGTYVTD